MREEVERLDDQGMAAWAGHDPEAWADLFADEFVVNDIGSPTPITDRAGNVAYAQAWFTAFPDMMLKQTNRVVSDDAVAAEVEFTGTNTGPMFMGGNEIPPTGKSVVGRGAYFAHVRDGKVVEFNAHPDIAGMMMQLGFMPEM
jgi:predicted ester cyclase